MNYYIYYQEKTTINYIYLLLLYKVAKYNALTKCYDTIEYNKITELVNTINKEYINNSISQSTVSRLLNNKEYNEYFIYNKTAKTIQLLNDFKKESSNTKRFIVLTDDEVSMLIQNNDNLLCKYYCYLKYFCGFTKSKEIDTTANQFLFASGYQNSGRYKTKLSEYNTMFAAQGYINIRKYRDNNGYWRNCYSFK